jgi:hypothetical protein
VQPVVEILQRLLLFCRKLIEFLKAFLQLFSLLARQPIKRSLALFGRHGFKLVDRRLWNSRTFWDTGPRWAPSPWRSIHSATSALRQSRRDESENRRSGDNRQNAIAPVHSPA